jgi:hypothetical protein
MPERRGPTLADAQRQVWVRGSIGLLLIGLALIFLLLILVKHVYQTPTYSFFPWGADLRRYVDPVLDDWSVLSLLWRSIPPRHPITGVPTTAMWEYVYAIWGAIVVGGIGGWLRSSAYKRRAQITEFRQEMEREAWRQQARAASGIAPDYPGSTTVIQQGIWYGYPAPPEPWSQTFWGIVILGLIVALMSGLVLLYAEYSYFQGRWPSSRN